MCAHLQSGLRNSGSFYRPLRVVQRHSVAAVSAPGCEYSSFGADFSAGVAASQRQSGYRVRLSRFVLPDSGFSAGGCFRASAVQVNLSASRAGLSWAPRRHRRVCPRWRAGPDISSATPRAPAPAPRLCLLRSSVVSQVMGQSTMKGHPSSGFRVAGTRWQERDATLI